MFPFVIEIMPCEFEQRGWKINKISRSLKGNDSLSCEYVQLSKIHHILIDIKVSFSITSLHRLNAKVSSFLDMKLLRHSSEKLIRYCWQLLDLCVALLSKALSLLQRRKNMRNSKQIVLFAPYYFLHSSLTSFGKRRQTWFLLKRQAIFLIVFNFKSEMKPTQNREELQVVLYQKKIIYVSLLLHYRVNIFTSFILSWFHFISTTQSIFAIVKTRSDLNKKFLWNYRKFNIQGKRLSTTQEDERQSFTSFVKKISYFDDEKKSSLELKWKCSVTWLHSIGIQVFNKTFFQNTFKMNASS